MLQASFVVLAGVATSIATRRSPTDPSMTALDGFMVNLDRVLPPNPGNIVSVVMKTDKVPSIADAKKEPHTQSLSRRYFSVPVVLTDAARALR
jgi:hypothetical protein